ncbi:MAG: hypothetical protein ACD_46C00297G0001 [uncultured bacterium]|nr:MAG: hypothetical protein ACD_46C00297G0001 [uncultured bacterium]
MNHEASKLKGLLWVFIACIIGLMIGGGSSILVDVTPRKFENKLQNIVDPQFADRGCRENPDADLALKKLISRIYPIDQTDKTYNIDVRVVKDHDINAYAELGGHIFINTGLLQQARSPEELAGVIAHEIGHVQHRDIFRAFVAKFFTYEAVHLVFQGEVDSSSYWTKFFLDMGFSRKQEARADEAGLLRLQKAHVDNSGLRDFFQRMEAMDNWPSFISDHPSDSDRLVKVEKYQNHGSTPILSKKEWSNLKNYCKK